MEAIRNYLDNVFAAYPQTSEVQTLKQEMLANMEEKYAALRQSGKSEHEAAYGVINDFGNIEEISAELGIDSKSVEIEENIFMYWDEAQNYLAQSKKNGTWIGLGVWLIIAGVSTVLFLDSVFIFFLTVAIAVVMFIMTGSKMEASGFYAKTPIRFDFDTRERVESARAEFMPRCNTMVAVGAAVIILSVGAFASINIPIPLFLNIVAFSVFLFIFAGFQLSAFDVLLGRGDYAKKAGVKKRDKNKK